MRKICVTFLLFVSTASMAWGDQAVITFRSGKTQTIQLEESADSVQDIRYLKDVTPQLLKPEVQSDKQGKSVPSTEKKPQNNAGPGLKWGKPIQGD